MCGISGFVGFDSKSKIENSLEIISHRGRDYRGVYSFKGGTFGHNRLSIQDRSELGNQPMLNDDGSLVLVYNGELWKGWNSKVKTLQDKGYVFKSNSDTEYLLNLFQDSFKNNDNLVNVFQKIDGVFGIGLYNDIKKEIIVARDWLGKIPVYYLHDVDCFAFGSELKQFVSFTTDLSKVKILEAGSILTYNIKEKNITIEKFKSIPEYVETTDTKNVLVSNIRDYLTLGVEKRMIGDVGIATILSGGVDSLLTTYLCTKINPDVTAFVVSVGDDSKKKKDLYYARKAADFMKIKLVEILIDKDYIEDNNNIRETIYAVETYDWRQVSPAILQIQMAKKINEMGFKVALGGELSDEIFASYGDVHRWYYEDEKFIKKRKSIIEKVSKGNIIRGNKAMLYGGTVELRMPFGEQSLVECALNIPPHYEIESGSLMKPLLREAFADIFPNELINRKKVTFQDGAGSMDFFKNNVKSDKDFLKKIYKDVFHV